MTDEQIFLDRMAAHPELADWTVRVVHKPDADPPHPVATHVAFIQPNGEQYGFSGGGYVSESRPLEGIADMLISRLIKNLGQRDA